MALDEEKLLAEGYKKWRLKTDHSKIFFAKIAFPGAYHVIQVADPDVVYRHSAEMIERLCEEAK